MATDIFTLLGTISVDTSDFHTKMNAAMTAVNNLAAAVNNLNGVTANINVNGGTGTTNGATTVTTAAATVTAAGNQQTGNQQTGNQQTGNQQTGNRNNAGNNQQPGNWMANIGNAVAQISAEMALDFAQMTWDAMVEAAHTGYDYNERMELWESQIANFVGPERAPALLADLEQHAIDTPYSMEYIMSAAVKLLGSNKVGPDELIGVLEMIGEYSNGETSNYGSVVTAVTQILTKDKLMAEEANKQLANAGVGIWPVMAKYFSLTNRDGQDEWTEADVMGLNTTPGANKITGKEFLEASYWATHDPEGPYYGRMDAVMNTTYGRAQKLEDSTSRTYGALMRSGFEVFSTETMPAITATLERLYTDFTDHKEVLDRYAGAVSDIAILGANLGEGLVDMALEAEEISPGILSATAAVASAAGFGALMTAGGGAAAGGGIGAGVLAGLGALGTALSLGGMVGGSALWIGVRSSMYDEEMAEAAAGDGYSPYTAFMSEEGRESVAAAGGRPVGLSAADMAGYFAGRAMQSTRDWFIRPFEALNPFNNDQLRHDTAAAIADFNPYEVINSLSDMFTTGMDWLLDMAASVTIDPAWALISDTWNRMSRDKNVPDLESPVQQRIRELLEQEEEEPELPKSKIDPNYRPRYNLPDGGGGRAEPTFFEDDIGFPNGMSSMMTVMQTYAAQVKSEVAAAVREGMSGVSITANVNTGNVTLDTGAVVGSIAPKVDMVLGEYGRRSSRG